MATQTTIGKGQSGTIKGQGWVEWVEGLIHHTDDETVKKEYSRSIHLAVVTLVTTDPALLKPQIRSAGPRVGKENDSPKPEN